jgi:hypothetical protein
MLYFGDNRVSLYICCIVTQTDWKNEYSRTHSCGRMKIVEPRKFCYSSLLCTVTTFLSKSSTGTSSNSSSTGSPLCNCNFFELHPVPELAFSGVSYSTVELPTKRPLLHRLHPPNIVWISATTSLLLSSRRC